MAFKASIEVDTVDEFKKLNETKVIEVPKIVYKDKVKRIEVPIEKTVEKIVEVKTLTCCPICGHDEMDDLDGPYEFTGIDGIQRQYHNYCCSKCGWRFSIGIHFTQGK